jgi:hypothetical protein
MSDNEEILLQLYFDKKDKLHYLWSLRESLRLLLLTRKTIYGNTLFLKIENLKVITIT